MKMRGNLPWFASMLLLLLLVGAIFRPYHAAVTVSFQDLLDAEAYAYFEQRNEVQASEREWLSSLTTTNVKALLAANDISARVDEVSGLADSNPPMRVFTLTFSDVDRHAVAAKANAAGRIVCREFARTINKLQWHRVNIWGDVAPPQIHLESELLQRVFFAANR